jgi:antitoxin VapB
MTKRSTKSVALSRGATGTTALEWRSRKPIHQDSRNSLSRFDVVNHLVWLENPRIDSRIYFDKTIYTVALSIKDPEADRLARELAAQTGETITQALIVALRERLARHRRKKAAPKRHESLRRLRESMRELPVLDARTPDEIIGYDDHGVPR